MAIERTLSILKPDAVALDITGKINTYIKNAGLEIIDQKFMVLTQEQAEEFYGVHRDKPFFEELVKFVCSGLVVVQVLSGEDAVRRYRELMGATDPKKADKGTIRGDFGGSITENRVHGSDSIENAHKEIALFFTESELSKL